MAEIRQRDLFGCLNRLGYGSMESAATYCKLRGNPVVELVHFIHQILNEADSDLHFIVRRFNIDAARLSQQLTSALDRLPRGASTISGFSASLREAVQQGWIYGSLMFKAGKVRTGHLLTGIVKSPNLQTFLCGMADEFRRIGPDQLTDEFMSIVSGSPEDGMEEPAGGGAVPGETSGAVARERAGGGSLETYSVDLTERARNGEIDPILGRDLEIRQIVDILMRRRQNNPILTGEAGVGKTAVVEGFACRIASGDVPPALRDVTLRTLDLGLLQAGASMKGEFENRLKQVIEEVQSSPVPIILFIDEAHTLIGAGGAAGQNDAANLLKPALARGTLRTIAATTWAEYKKYFEKDPALTRRFQVIKVEEPDELKAVRMIRGLAPVLEKHHQVPVLDSALEAAAKLSNRYIPSRQLPDKAVSLIDTACARVAISQHATPAQVEDSTRLIEALQTEIGILEREQAVGLNHVLRLKDVRKQMEDEEKRLSTLKERWTKEKELVSAILELRRQAQEALKPAAESGAAADAGPEDLQQMAERTGPSAPPEAFRLIRKTAAVLAKIHRAGNLHRDIKPSAVFLSAQGGEIEVSLLSPPDGEVIINAAFASPEQVKEDPLDARSDIFSLGITLWFLIEGASPFTGSDRKVFAERLSATEYEPRLPAALTGPLRAAVARMIAKEPAARHATCEELLADLDACLSTFAATAPDPAPAGPPVSPQMQEARKLEADLAALQGESPLVFPHVDEQAVAAVISDWTGIPAGRMVKNEIEQTLNLASILRRRVIGQDHALEVIARRMQTSRARLDNPNRPIGVFMLVGPSGTGKTETALTLAETLFGDESSLIGINMSEFQESHTVSTLKGAPPGYVGYGEGGRLTEAVRRRPYSVVLLDEVEKAHSDVHEIFFQVFDKGWMEDGEGRSIDFKNTIIILTSNAAQDVITALCKDPDLMPGPDALEKAMRGPLTKVFPDALLNRLVVVPYYPISIEMLRTIIDLNLRKVQKRIRENHGIPFTWDDSVPELIAKRCTELERGARMVDAMITNQILPEVGRELLARMAEGILPERIQIKATNTDFQLSF